MNRKYTIDTGSELNPMLVAAGPRLYRIVACRSFKTVHGIEVLAGERGGFVESDDYLSHEGNCWIADDARVYNGALVTGNAFVCGNAKVGGNTVVYGNAIVKDNAVLHDCEVFDKAKIADWSAANRCKFFGSAVVYDNAKVYDSTIGGHSKIGSALVKNADAILREQVCWFSNVGSENGTLTAYRDKHGGVSVTRGCFHGKLEMFETAVYNAHKNTQRYSEYMILIDYLKLRFKEELACEKLQREKAEGV
jgi:carbonic anhydrase/acetyltransferase-like protein (isoleucine patch superfamily)